MHNASEKSSNRMMTTVAALLICVSASVAALAQNVGGGVSVGGIGTAGAGISTGPTGSLGGGAGANSPQANGVSAGLGFGGLTGQGAGAGAGVGAADNAVGVGLGLPGSGTPGSPGTPANPAELSPTLVSQFNSLDSADRVAIKRRCAELVASSSRQESQLATLCKLIGK